MEIMYDKYADLLYRLALANLQDKSDAEDVVHDVFIKFFEKSPHFQDENHEKGWFIRVTVNMCRDLQRKKKYRTHLPLDEIYHLEGEDIKLPHVFQVLEHLSERYRLVIVLHYLEGYSVNEIAQILQISVSAVKMRLSRGRELLKEKIEKEETYD